MGTKQPISILITDIDNTLFDWFGFWHTSFSALLEKVLERVDLDRDELLDSIREIHQKHGTSEYSMLLEDLPQLRTRFDPKQIRMEFADAISAYREARKRSTVLYGGVRETLIAAKAAGTCIVAYTDSLQYYALTRVKYLELDGIVDYLYSPPDHESSDSVSSFEEIRTQPAERYRPSLTKQMVLPKGATKPSPEVLHDILLEVNGKPSDAIYVGDSLFKDIAMAQDAGVLDVFAAYGVAHGKSEYELLRRVTHWTAQQVETEKRLSARDITPTFTLQKSFAELCDLFEFTSHKGQRNGRNASS